MGHKNHRTIRNASIVLPRVRKVYVGGNSMLQVVKVAYHEVAPDEGATGGLLRVVVDHFDEIWSAHVVRGRYVVGFTRVSCIVFEAMDIGVARRSLLAQGEEEDSEEEAKRLEDSLEALAILKDYTSPWPLDSEGMPIMDGEDAAATPMPLSGHTAQEVNTSCENQTPALCYNS